MKVLQGTSAVLGNPILSRTLADEAATVARWRHGSVDAEICPSDLVRIAISLVGGHQVRHRVNADAAQRRISVGSAAVFPAGAPINLAIEGEADILQVFLEGPFLEAMGHWPASLPTMFDMHDYELQAAATQMLVGATRNEPDDELLFGGGVHAIAAWLFNHAGDKVSKPARGGLAPVARRRVEDLINASLDDETSRSPNLTELSAAAGLSVDHFIRAFRRQTGTTPYRHVLQSRLTRALTLLRRPGTSVAETADRTGFVTPAHFVATFRRMTGVTPGAARSALLHDERPLI